MSVVHCSFCSGKFATFNFYIQHMIGQKCGAKSLFQGEMAEQQKKDAPKTSPVQKRKFEDLMDPMSTTTSDPPAKKSSTTSVPQVKKTITQAMAPQQKAKVAPATMTKNGKARCEFCMKMIKPRGMTQHLNVVHKCRYCSDYVENMESHISSSHENEPCDHCSKRFLNRAKVEVHMKESHVWPCEECEDRFFSPSALAEHVEEAHTFDHCDICDEKLKKDDGLMDEHKDKVHGIKRKVMKEFGGGMMFMMMAAE